MKLLLCLGMRIRLLASFLSLSYFLQLGEYYHKLRKLLILFVRMYVLRYLCIHVIVTSQECTNTVIVGSPNHDNKTVTPGEVFILADYTIPCTGTVVAWEFCYQINSASSATFYPGIWKITGRSGINTDYALVQSNTVTYNPSRDLTNNFRCQIFSLSDTDQFTAPAGSVVGLNSGFQTQLLRTNNGNSITTYRFAMNQRSFKNAGSNENVSYNISVRIHLGKCAHVIKY